MHWPWHEKWILKACAPRLGGKDANREIWRDVSEKNALWKDSEDMTSLCYNQIFKNLSPSCHVYDWTAESLVVWMVYGLWFANFCVFSVIVFWGWSFDQVWLRWCWQCHLGPAGWCISTSFGLHRSGLQDDTRFLVPHWTQVKHGSSQICFKCVSRYGKERGSQSSRSDLWGSSQGVSSFEFSNTSCIESWKLSPKSQYIFMYIIHLIEIPHCKDLDSTPEGFKAPDLFSLDSHASLERNAKKRESLSMRTWQQVAGWARFLPKTYQLTTTSVAAAWHWHFGNHWDDSQLLTAIDSPSHIDSQRRCGIPNLAQRLQYLLLNHIREATRVQCEDPVVVMHVTCRCKIFLRYL